MKELGFECDFVKVICAKFSRLLQSSQLTSRLAPTKAQILSPLAILDGNPGDDLISFALAVLTLSRFYSRSPFQIDS